MKIIQVKQIFEDLKEGVLRQVGDSFEVSNERADEIIKKLPKGYVSVEDVQEEDKEEPTEEAKETKPAKK